MYWIPSNKVIRWLAPAQRWSRQTGCPAALILAIIQQESGGDPAATRYEPGYEEKYKARCDEIARACRLSLEVVATSYGLMQLMLPLAWGYMGPDVRRGNVVATLLDPEQNIRFGAAHLGILLKKELARHNDAMSLALGLRKEIDAAVVRAVAGRYNGGGSGSAYVRNVCALWQRYEKYLKEAGV
ncbi:transglycosylase SLT domain-containing protein [Cloacibacillus porcorum]|uniref:transglycosylase SLT domain-containing protein n=1 Tax=Cloacibacillus porcorum TaxID=1197717 RepID=UPI00258DBBF3|nr:transglycosylase SLT domain-containing protein [Cloacibacillus porcorum]